LNKAYQNGSFKEARNILFLAVGAGITITIGWYQNEPGL